MPACEGLLRWQPAGCHGRRRRRRTRYLGLILLGCSPTRPRIGWPRASALSVSGRAGERAIVRAIGGDKRWVVGGVCVSGWWWCGGGGGRRGAAHRAGGEVVVGSGMVVGWVSGVLMAHVRARSSTGVDRFRLLGGGVGSAGSGVRAPRVGVWHCRRGLRCVCVCVCGGGGWGGKGTGSVV